MARNFDLGLQIVALTAAEDLSTNQYGPVMISGAAADGRSQVIAPKAAGVMVYGVQRNKLLYSRGDKTVEIAYNGLTQAIGNGSVTVDCRVAASGTVGQFRKAEAADWVRGIAVTGDGGTAGGRFTLDLHHMGKEPA